MKPSQTLHMNKWVLKLHPPLPRTERESKQLLNLLTSSFRSQLDKHHPPVGHRESDHDASSAAHISYRGRRNSTGNRSHEEARSSAAIRPTEAHLQGILNHPLFSMPTNHQQALASRQKQEAYAQRVATEPLNVFCEEATAGLVTAKSLEACFRSLLRIANDEAKQMAGKSTSVSWRGAYIAQLANSQAAVHLVSVLQGMDKRTRRTIFESSSTVGAMLPFLVATSQHEVIGQWLQEIYETSMFSHKKATHQAKEWLPQYNLIKNLIISEIEVGAGLDSAILGYDRICEFHRLCLPDAVTASALLQSGRFLLRWLVTNAHSQKPSPASFDQFLKTRPQWSAAKETKAGNFLDSALLLYHPTSPNGEPYLRFFQRKTDEWVQSTPEQARALMLRVSLDAARVLLDQGKVSDATSLMDLVKRRFAVDLELQNLEKMSSTSVQENATTYEDLVQDLELAHG